MNSRRCGVYDRNLKKLLIYLLVFLPSVAYDPDGRQKLDRLQNLTLFIHLFIYYMNIQNVSSSRLYNRLQSVNGLLGDLFSTRS